MIDFDTATDEELRAHAKQLGLRISPNASRERVIERIQTATTKEVATVTTKQAPKMYTINIHKTEDKNEVDPVPVGVNGYIRTIKRGVDVTVPEAVVEVLRNAKQKTYEQIKRDDGKRDMIERESLSYPFSIVNVIG